MEGGGVIKDFTPKKDVVAGDVCFYSEIKDELLFVKPDKLEYDPTLEPVGIVYIPSSHDIFGNGMCGIISVQFADLDYNIEDDGSMTFFPYFSASRVDLQKKRDEYSVRFSAGISHYKSMNLGYIRQDYTTKEYTVTWYDSPQIGGTSHFPSDSFSDYICPNDSNCGYNKSVELTNTNYGLLPSPYNTNGSKNSVFFQSTGSYPDSNVATEFASISGSISEPPSSKWDIDEILKGWYRPGLSVERWRWPRLGDCAYLLARWKVITTVISRLKEVYPNSVNAYTDASWITDSGHSDYYWWAISTNRIITYITYTNNYCSSLPVARV